MLNKPEKRKNYLNLVLDQKDKQKHFKELNLVFVVTISNDILPLPSGAVS